MNTQNPPLPPGNARPDAGRSSQPAAARPLSPRLARILSLHDFETAAQAHLPRPVFGYIAGAAEDNRSQQANRSAFDAYEFVPRVLVNIAGRSTATTLFGERHAAPFGIAPVGLSALSAYRGDIVLAQGAERAGVPMIMSGSSLIRLEDVARASPAAWFQAYLPGKPDDIVALVERAARAGFRKLVVTVDTPAAANRENNLRAGFSTPLRPTARLAWDGLTHPRWLFGTFLKTIARHGIPHFENNFPTRGAPIISPNVERDFSHRGHLTWEHFALVRRTWKGILVIKGVLHPDDARIARDHGADGVIVSNHGGRQLDGAVAPLRVLPGIVAAVPELPVMMDSGVRRGADVLKALALGAKMVFAGRPFAYAAAVGGEAGVAHAINLLQAEVSRNMAMLGISSLGELDAQRFLRRVDGR
ncbi:alpha-hydroxy acid oxidase [Ramlibacter sp.]|uniref:alpha-hydroxy acid oxidase n=1 Tax=Ramlibacter sp. TaxID=1917967 RepID=UPI002B809F49|nr:alpha-hydroxy acid oxidase [Ramlibacter sp.]HWI84613.1 alpha-hydroxy acid oxidase [Ramlibacter sp.]